MNELATSYRAWILAQDIDGCTIREENEHKIVLVSEKTIGEVNFYEINDSMVVELRLISTKDDESLFFLHFELEDITRAQELFNEMHQAIVKVLNRTIRHVLLCCTCGITTTFFSKKLNEAAQQMGLDYDFCAMPLSDAIQQGGNFAAVLLAPQVGHMRKQVTEALPDSIVIELPGRIFGSYDANAALSLVVETVSGVKKAAQSDLRMARDFDHSKCVLGVTYVLRKDEPTLSFRVLDKGKVTQEGMLIRRIHDIHALDDLMATLRVTGYTLDMFDAIGIAIPGIVDNGIANIENISGEPVMYDIAGELSKIWGVPVYVDNLAIAAAAGCYVMQDKWDDVAFHAQTVGVAACDEGLVIGGLPRAGRAGFAGNLSYLANEFSLSMDLDDAAWRYDGTRELVAHYLAATICTVSPQAIFVWCDLLPDMDDLHDELCKTLPEHAIPQLIAVSDYDGLTLMGVLALCLQRLD